MVPPCVVMGDEVFELPFKIARQIMVFEQDAVFERAVPTFDLAVRLRVIGRTSCVREAVCIEPCA